MSGGVSELGFEHHHNVAFHRATIAFALNQNNQPRAAEYLHLDNSVDLVLASRPLNTAEVTDINHRATRSRSL